MLFFLGMKHRIRFYVEESSQYQGYLAYIRPKLLTKSYIIEDAHTAVAEVLTI